MRLPFRISPRVAFALALTACGLSFFPRAALARAIVVEDSPGRLVVEVSVSDYRAEASEGGSRLVAPGFAAAAGAGAPDLPWYRFMVATGDRMPAVSVEPLEWADVALPGGLAGVPEWITLTQPEARRDAAKFAAARGLVPEVSEFDTYRGMRLRHVALPLAIYSAGETRARVLKRFRVRVDFPDPGLAPSPGVAPWLRQADVLNPAGGAYLVSLPRPAPLRKAAAASAFDPGTPWLKIRVGNRVTDDLAEDGVYALTYEAFAAGLSASSAAGIQVGRLRMYAGPKDTATSGLSGAIAPTLREIPVEVREASPANGTFDAGDTILFYAHGTSIWVPVGGGALPAVQWMFKSDPWSFENDYFLQWSGSGSGALRLQSAAGPAAADTAASAPHYLRAERDLTGGSCDPSGFAVDDEAAASRYWYTRFSCGDAGGAITLSASQMSAQSWDSLPGRASDSTWIGFFTARSEGFSGDAFPSWKNGTPIPFLSNIDIPGSWYLKTSGYGDRFAPLFDSMRWDGSDQAFEGYTVRYVRSLAWSEGRVVFPAATGRNVAYKVTGVPSGGRVLRVEAGVGARWIALQPVGGAAAFSDSVGAGEDVQYLFVHRPLSLAGDALAAEAGPTADRVIQDLRDGSLGGGRRNPDYLIIAPAALLPEAVALAKYRDYSENPSQPLALQPAVVRVEDIYREWSGGRMSPMAIRDFLHWARDHWGPGDAPGDLKYVLLFGDGHYDYRDFRNGGSGTPSPNHIPPFLSNDVTTDPMCTDDLYAVVDSAKSWRTSTLDLAVGRLPVRTREEARDYLDKVARYESPASSGSWRSRMLLTGDDATQRRNANGRDLIPDHTAMSESFGNAVLAQDSGLRKESIYLFDYPRNAQYLKPEATEALLSSLNQGMLFFLFYGHGAYNQLADEVFLKTNDGLARLRNGDKSFGMLIFSCTVGRFDKLADEGMVEQFLRDKGNGAIFGIAGSRETYATSNKSLGDAVAARLFEPASDSATLGIGEVLRRAKNAVGNSDNRKYVVLGEPVLVVNRPPVGLGLDARPDSLQALGCDTLHGRVTRGSGRGAVSLRIVSGDVPKTYETYPGADSINVKKRGQILFERTVPYVDSAFSLEYFLPKQVPFGDTGAKLQLFAWDSAQARESALLVKDVPISGVIADGGCLVDDHRGPRVTVTGCNTREAGEVDFPDNIRISLPYCLQVSVSDTGAGVTGGDGPDQGVTMELVGSLAPFQPQPTVDDLYRKTYQVQLSPQEVSDGTHLFKVSARDGFGNLTQRQITLQVAQDTVLRFVRAFNTPNPLKRGETTFWFSTTLPVEEGGDLTSPNQDRIDFHIRIFNQRGYMVKEFRGARSGETRWDGRDAWGRTLANGIYFYDVTATWSESNGGPAGGRSQSRRNILVISR